MLSMQRPGHARHVVQQYLQPLRKDLIISVTISIRTLCLASTGLDDIIHAISNSSRLPVRR